MNIDKKYDIIYADPAWSYYQNKGRGCAANHYQIRSDEELCNLPVKEIAAEKCFLLMWITSPKWTSALKLIESWGFTYKTVFFTWLKINKNNGEPKMGLGHYTRSCTEFCIIATRGNPKVKDFKRNNSINQVIVESPREHSRKPDEARERINQFFRPELKRIELFARTTPEPTAEGIVWDVWGNETTKF